MNRRKTVTVMLAVLAGFIALTAASPANQARRTAAVTVYLAPT